MNVDFKLPPLGENVAGGDVVSVLVREGDVIAANDGVMEIETDKAVVEIPCPQAGKISKVLVAKGQAVKVGQPLLTLETESVETQSAPVAPSARPQAVVAETEAVAAAAQEIPAGPEARRLARELGVDLARVQGTGRGGRISVEDVRAAASHAASPAKPPQQPEQSAATVAGIPAQRGSREPAVPPGILGEDTYGHVRREPMSRIRRTIAAQMTKSASTIPHVTNFDDADVTELERLRKTIPPAYLGPTVKLTAMPFALKAVALALRQHPLLNASLDEEKGEIVYKQYVSLGVAVDTPRGLVVPVIRNADRLGILDIARELTLLAARAARPSSPSMSFAAARSPSATLVPSAAFTAPRSSTIPRWPSCSWVGRAGCWESTKARSRAG